MTAQLTLVELAAALAMAERQGRITPQEHGTAWSNFLSIWPDLDVVNVTAELTVAAADLARTWGLRGYDAVHCAAAISVRDPELVAAAGDSRLIQVWATLDVAVADTNRTLGP